MTGYVLFESTKCFNVFKNTNTTMCTTDPLKEGLLKIPVCIDSEDVVGCMGANWQEYITKGGRTKYDQNTELYWNGKYTIEICLHRFARHGYAPCKNIPNVCKDESDDNLFCFLLKDSMKRLVGDGEEMTMICTEIIFNIHTKLKATGKFDNLFDCVSVDKIINSQCREKRLEFKEECDLFIKTVNLIMPIDLEISNHELAEKIISCFPMPKHFWGVCDTAVEGYKNETYCTNLCDELQGLVGSNDVNDT